VLRKSLISDFGMKVVSDLDFPGDKKDKLLAKASQAAKKDAGGTALKTAEKRVGELEQWLTLVLCYCPDVAALDAFLHMSVHINPDMAAPSPAPAPAPAPAMASSSGWSGTPDDPWADEGVPPQSASAAPPVAGAGSAAEDEGMALVVQDYQPSFAGAVAVVADEIVTVLDASSPDWWLVRTSDGREGAVPSTFLVRDEGASGFDNAAEAQFASAATFAMGAAAAPAPAAPAAATPVAAAEERVLMVLTNDLVPFAQKIKTSAGSLAELEDVVQERLQLDSAINLCEQRPFPPLLILKNDGFAKTGSGQTAIALARTATADHALLYCVGLYVSHRRWCALPGGSAEPERVTDLGALPMLAKVYVKPGMVNIIAAVHNGDLTHGVSMEVCDAVRFWAPQPAHGQDCTDR
jgi:hypothetical protein